MNLLFLGNIDSPLIEIIRSFGEDVITTTLVVTPYYLAEHHIDFIISYGYPHIISEDVIKKMHGKAINLHISYLPWNRGSDPDLWSVADDTPKGVTIHYLDKGVDTGDIIAQKEVACSPEDTLGEYYDRLHRELQEMFRETWPNIKLGKVPRIKQEGEGSCHLSVDREKFVHLLTKGSDTLVKELLMKD
ncbi:MAG TPA: formyl transferase [Phycisphaerales bacterium]|nr:formyl transferase [Phycisphaerales bacterium]